MPSVLAILRAGIFSPNHIANDAAILHAVVAELKRRGCAVRVLTEAEFVEAPVDEDIVLAMCRGSEAIVRLQALEDSGVTVINSGYGIENCIRVIMVRLLKDAGMPIPDCIVTDTDIDIRRRLGKGGYGACWVKRGDGPIRHLEDICRCRHPEEAQEILHEFFFRKIPVAVVSKDVEGEKIRCYGIRSSNTFHCFMPFSSHRNPLEETDSELFLKVRDLCMKAAEILRIDIFGCDVVQTADGECFLVNFDDWPSFAPIRKEAAKAIARSVMAHVRNLSHNRKKP